MKLTFSLTLIITLIFSTSAIAQEDHAGKQKLLMDLQNKKVKAEGKTSVPADISGAESVCNNSGTTITECRRSIRATEKGYKSHVKNEKEKALENNAPIIINQGGYNRGPVQLPARR